MKRFDKEKESKYYKFGRKRKPSYYYLFAIALIFSAIYIIWNIPKTKADPNVMNAGCFKMIFTDGSSNIDLLNAYPISDDQGALTNAYNFTIENTCSLAASYQVNLESLEDSTLSLSRIKISIDNEEPVLLSSLDNAYNTIPDAIESKILRSGKLTAGTTKSYSIRLWLDDSVGTDTISSDTFKGKLVITTTSNKK